MLMSAVAASPKFEIRFVGPRSSMSGGGPGRVSSISLTGNKWTVTNQGFGNPPTSAPLDAKLGAEVLAASTAFLATNPRPALDPAYSGYSNTITIEQGSTHRTFDFSSDAAAALRDMVLAAANR